MKLYFTLTDGVEKSQINLDMLRLALKSAKENTSLELYALYDGTKDDKAYKIFQEYGTHIIMCKCSFADKIEKYYQNQSTDIRSGIKRMLGCFMKFDIALHEKSDDVVLYADIDTMFLKDADWDSFKVKTIAAAPEFEQNYDIIKGYKYFGAAPMLINISEARKRREKLFYMLDNHLEPYQECWDQGFWNELYKDDFEPWPLEFNWKPYWGINENATIVHIHGFKLGSMTEDDAKFCGPMINRFSGAFEGWLYYTMKAYRILEYDRDLYVAKLAEFLKKSQPEIIVYNKKQWYFSTYFLYWIYKKLSKKHLSRFSQKIYQFCEKKLQKRKVL